MVTPWLRCHLLILVHIMIAVYDSRVLSADGHIRFSSLKPSASEPALHPVVDLKHISRGVV